jgi:lauroyl/myristoyl acyltransferase
MSIGSYLLTNERLEFVRKKSWKFGRIEIIEQGMRYYDSHPDDVDRIRKNLEYMGLPSQGAAMDSVLRGIVAHYFEKLFVMVKTYEIYWIAKNRVEMGNSLDPFLEAKETGKAVFVGQSHFGATYLMGIALTTRGIDLNVVGNFPDPVGGMMREINDLMVRKYGTGSAEFINLAKGDVDVPMEMMRLLMTGKVVSNVYDENNRFCRPVELLGKKVMGGTGMDLILRNFNEDKVIAVTPFLVRTSDETFRYELDKHELGRGDLIKSFYRSLEKRIERHCEQWYFIHELHHSFVNE